MRVARYVLFLMSESGNEYCRVGKTSFDSVSAASTSGFLAHCKMGGGNRPYLVLPESQVGPLESLDADFARSETELHDSVTQDGIAILTVQELRSYLLHHGSELDTVALDYLLFAQSYGADNCHEQHETRYGCDCWVGMTEEDTEMLLEEVADNTSTYPAFKLVTRSSHNAASQPQDDWFPSGLASAMSKLSRVIATGKLKGARLPETQLGFLQDVLRDLKISAAMWED